MISPHIYHGTSHSTEHEKCGVLNIPNDTDDSSKILKILMAIKIDTSDQSIILPLLSVLTLIEFSYSFSTAGVNFSSK